MKELCVAPSAFSFLYDECKRCFYDAALGRRKRPMMPMPTVFVQIDLAMKRHFADGWHSLIGCPERFKIVAQGRRVMSRAIPIEGTDASLRIRGYYDSLIEFEGGAQAVIDWKTSEVRPALVGKYARSLHAYAHALEHPAAGEPMEVDRLGLGVFHPGAFEGGAAFASLVGRLQWLEIPRQVSEFNAFVQDVGHLLMGSTPPPNRNCPYCAYRHAA